jgi:AhpD family alkylhydroperoxidase
MTRRLNATALAPELYKAYLTFSTTQKEKGVDVTLRDLVNIRASQINGCAFCLDMHVKEAKIHGERELRLHHVAIWRESPLFTPRERAALAWTEAVTVLGRDGVPDEVYEQARSQFSEKELVQLTFAVVTINGWNRLSIAFRNEPGSADAAMGLTKAGLS